MGQYYILLNLDKREMVTPHDIDGSAKLWEWCANVQAGIIAFLIARSDEWSGGDPKERYEYHGHWAGDRVVLIGDYDSSGLYRRAETEFKDISRQAGKEFHKFLNLVNNLRN